MVIVVYRLILQPSKKLGINCLLILSKQDSFGLIGAGVSLLAQHWKIPFLRTLQQKLLEEEKEPLEEETKLSGHSHHGFPHLLLHNAGHSRVVSVVTNTVLRGHLIMLLFYNALFIFLIILLSTSLFAKSYDVACNILHCSLFMILPSPSALIVLRINPSFKARALKSLNAADFDPTSLLWQFLTKEKCQSYSNPVAHLI